MRFRWNKPAAVEVAAVLILAAVGAVGWRVVEIAIEADRQFLRQIEFAACIRSEHRHKSGKIQWRNGMPVATFPVELNADRRPVVPAEEGPAVDPEGFAIHQRCGQTIAVGRTIAGSPE